MNFARDIQGSLDTNNFIKLVRPLCVLTQGASFISNEDIVFQGLQQFNNIGLVLCAAKDRDNTQLFKSPTTYQAVLNLITNSEYSSGLINVAAELTAANIIRSLPLNDSLRLIDRGNTLEQRAYSNLDRIIFLYTNNNAVTTNTTNNGLTEYFFFAPALDKTTLPDTSFDVGLETEIINLTNVQAAPFITVNSNQISFIYYNILKSEPGTPPLLNEGATEAFNGETVESLIFRLTSDINNLCTNVYTTGIDSYPFSNLLAVPTRTINRDTSISVKKKDLYPNTTTFKNKVANFLVNLYSVYIEFSARRLSTIVATEAIVVRPITIHKASLVTGYIGVYNNNNNYSINDVVIFNNQGYRSLVANNTFLPTDNTKWLLLDLSTTTYTINDLISKKNSYLFDYIDGLVVGKQSNNTFTYTGLQAQGPLSTIIDVNRGVTSSSSATATNNRIDHQIEIDTFYFSVSDINNPFCTQAGKLFFRISTLSNDVPWVPINILVGDKPEDVAFKLLQRLVEYRVADDTHVVGAQIYNNAVYINAYKITNPEVKVVVDIKFEGVEGITVAAYYHLEAPQSTAYNTSPRSVAVTTILRITNNPPTNSNINRGASIVDMGRRGNSKMSKVRDKIGTLNDVQGSQYVWNRSSMY